MKNKNPENKERNNSDLHQDYFNNLSSKIKKDDIVNSIKLPGSKISWEYDLEVFDKNWKFVDEMDMYSVFEYLAENYDFLVTVPEIYKETLLWKWEMIPVSPSDRQDAKWFVWTLWKEPLFAKWEKRFIVKVKKNKIWNKCKFWWKTLFPRLTWKDKWFSWVCFLDSSEKLKNWDGYEIIWFFDWEKIIEDLSFYSKEKISEISNNSRKLFKNLAAA